MNVTDESGQGFLLTRQQFENNGQTYLDFWVKTSCGAKQLITEPQKFVFFIATKQQPAATQVLKDHNLQFECKALSLKTFHQDPVTACYFRSQRTLFLAKDLLSNIGVTLYEDDVRLADRFLMERFVYGALTYKGAQTENTPSRLLDVKVKPGDYRPDFSILSLDIECSEKGDLYSIGLAATDYKKVIMIGPEAPGEEWIIWVKDETTLLHKFIEELNLFDPDIIVGWSVIGFDFRLLFKRSERFNVPLRIGRNNGLAFWREPKERGGQGYAFIPGRVIIDGIDALKTATYQFDSFSLESVSQNLLGKGKKVEDVHNRLAEIKHDFLHNKVKLAEYNLQDCVLVLEIFEKTQLIDFLILRSQLTGLELDRSGGSVAAFSNLYMPKLHRAGYISPNRPAGGGLASPGGYVMNSKPGLYQNVLVLDYKSLYPSIIRTFSIDPMGLIEGLLHPDDALPGYRGASFSRDKHFLPDIITHLWQERDEAKKQKDAARSQAIKILMNSFYGVLGSGGCRFYDTKLASSITMRGHDIMQTTAKWIEEAGYEVIYGDTDSTFVRLDDALNHEQASNIGTALAKDINHKWQAKLHEEFQIESNLEMEFETHFSPFLMPTIRGSETGSKKRYAGMKKAKDKQELVFKGLETVRSDWTALAKEFQQTLYQMVFDKQEVSAYILETVENTIQGKNDGKLVYRKRLRQPLNKYIKNVPPHVRAARIADDKNAQLGRQLQYQNKGWINYVLTLNGPEPAEYQESALDYEQYIEKQLKPVADAILPFIGESFDKIYLRQMGLF